MLPSQGRGLGSVLCILNDWNSGDSEYMTAFFNGEYRTGGFNAYFVVDRTELILHQQPP
jgi:hypothetical protein